MSEYQQTTVRIQGKYIFNNTYCNCLKRKEGKFNPSDYVKNNTTKNSSNMSQNMKNSQILNNTTKGRVTFGQPFNKINYLGRLEGQLGGSGQSIKNTF